MCIYSRYCSCGSCDCCLSLRTCKPNLRTCRGCCCHDNEEDYGTNYDLGLDPVSSMYNEVIYIELLVTCIVIASYTSNSQTAFICMEIKEESGIMYMSHDGIFGLHSTYSYCMIDNILYYSFT